MKMTFEQAVTSPEFSHCRAKSWRLSGYVKDNSDYVVYVYHFNSESPSGVLLAAHMNGLDEAVAILDRIGIPFPLSPTEKR